MRIDRIIAGAFGPFRGRSLDLAPGMNVVHGPNEAGKSSWFAAAYAGLAGRRRQRGRGTTAQAEFAKRHKPWSGSQWVAGVVITLDDGSTLAIENNLGRGETRIADGQTGRVISLTDLERRLATPLTTESTFDGARILGLNRDTARATIYTGQADVLRVLEDASQLQEYLERAASTEAVDATADGALIWLTDQRSTLVGSESVGNRPLRASRLALRQAREETTAERDRLARLYQVISDRQQLGSSLAQAKAGVEAADRQAKWQKVRDLQDRVDRAARLESELSAAGPATPINEETVKHAAGVLSVYDAGHEAGVLPDGPSAASLNAEIETLPEHPHGDLEPNPDTVARRQQLIQAQTALATHEENAPAEPTALAETSLSSDEIRSLAGTLEEAAPVVDPSLAAELETLQHADSDAIRAYEEAQVAYEAATRRNDDLLRQHGEAIEQHKQAFAAYEQVRAEQEVRRRSFYQAMEEYNEASSAYERARGEREARRQEALRIAEQQTASRAKQRWAFVAIGLLVLLAGVGLAVVGQVLPGAITAAVGAVLALVGFVPSRGRDAASAETSGADLGAPPSRPAPLDLEPLPEAPVQPTPPRLESVQAPVAPPPNPRIMDLKVRIRTQGEAVQAHAALLAAANARLAEGGLDPEPANLRQLARTIDDIAASRTRHQAHLQQSEILRSARDGKARTLAEALGVQIDVQVSNETVDALEAHFQTYATACRERAVIAKQADRKADLEAALAQRVRVEEAHAAAVADREKQASALLAAAADISGSPASTAAEAASVLRNWLDEQEQSRITQTHRAEVTARFDQVLDGKSLSELKAELDELTAAAGPEPESIPADIDTVRSQAKQLHDALLDRSGQLMGQQQQLASSLGPVAATVEQEAEAERAVRRVETLASCIDTAAAELTKAKEKANADIAPAIRARVAPWLPAITNGRYLDVRVDPSDLTMEVSEASGARRDARLLSHGTTEQLFLLLRIALAQTLSDDGETAPMILDDVTVQSDQERTIAILQMLHRLSKERQVVLFSQEDEVAEWAHANLTGDSDSFITLPGPG
jgi:uncharacterized protein YhaN